jgi:hypothetical protein
MPAPQVGAEAGMSRKATIAALLLFVGFRGSEGLAGQTRSAARPVDQTRVPRMLDGRPDFQGVWSFGTLTPLERPREFADKPFLSDTEAAELVQRQLAAANADIQPSASYNEFWFERPTSLVRLNGRILTSRIIDPLDGRIPPLTHEAQERVDAIQMTRREHPADDHEVRTRPERCLSPTPLGFEPAGAGTSNFLQVVQTSEHLVVLSELMSARRMIHMTAGKHLSSSIRLSLGDSRARWEGDSLVVDTTNYSPGFDFTFLGTDNNLHITERLTLVDADTLLHETTIDDPTVFTKPWTVVLPMVRTSARTFEFACHEGNYALRHILAGARAEESDRSRGRP